MRVGRQHRRHPHRGLQVHLGRGTRVLRTVPRRLRGPAPHPTARREPEAAAVLPAGQGPSIHDHNHGRAQRESQHQMVLRFASKGLRRPSLRPCGPVHLRASYSRQPGYASPQPTASDADVGPIQLCHPVRARGRDRNQSHGQHDAAELRLVVFTSSAE